jgi:glycosyltransferase involved in cell wall biosynthesis
MRIGIKATQIGPGGGLAHLVHCLRWFGELAPDDQFIVYGHTGQASLFPHPPKNVFYRLYRTPSHGLVARLFWEMTQFPQVLAGDECDILLELGNYATPNPPCPTVTLVHNLAPFIPEYVRTETPYQRFRLKLLKQLTLWGIKHAAGTIFVSEFERRTLNALVKAASRPAAVIYHGIAESKESVIGDMPVDAAETDGCVLCVSHIYRYKGILELVLGYALALREDSSLPDLVIAGTLYDKPYVARIRAVMAAAKIESRVHFLGNVGERQLHRLYSRCRFFVFPSTIESASVILLEALASHCAIACSNVSVMPEICADAATYFDPSNGESIADSLVRLHQDDNLRKTLSERAARRAGDFSWRATAQQTLGFLHAVHTAGNPAESSATGRRQPAHAMLEGSGRQGKGR